MPRSFLVKKRPDQMSQQTTEGTGVVTGDSLDNHGNRISASSSSFKNKFVDGGRTHFSVESFSTSPVTDKVMYGMSRDTNSQMTSPDSAELRNNSTIERTLGHQKDQATNAATDLRNLHFSNPVPLSFADGRQLATGAHPASVAPPIGRDVFAAAWLAELHRLYYGGFVQAAATGASAMTSPFPLPPPSTFLLSLASQHRMLMQQLLHVPVAPPDAGLRKGEEDAQREGITGQLWSETLRSTTTDSSSTASVKPKIGALNGGQKRVVSNRNGSETKRLNLDVTTRRRSTGLNDFSIPSILGGNGRFGGRRRGDSGSAGSCGGATSGADSEDAWSTCTGSPSAEPETLSKLCSSDSEMFDEDKHDLRCQSADRRNGFQTAVINSSNHQRELYRQPIAGSYLSPLTVHSFPPTSPMSSTSSSLSTSPPIYFREAPTSRASSVTSVDLNKCWKQEPMVDASKTSEVDRERGVEGRVVSRQTMVADSSSNNTSRHFECPQCEKVYSSVGALKMHIRTHTLPCQCPLCGKSFSRPWLLQGHLRTHTGERPFRCQQCDRAFADRSNLRAHLQTHANVKRYRCDRCSKAFSRASLLTKHQDGNCAGGLGLYPVNSLPIALATD